MGEIVRRLMEGYETVIEWSPDDPESVEAARERLKSEIEAGYLAVRADGAENEPVTELPPHAERVILTMPMGGGA